MILARDALNRLTAPDLMAAALDYARRGLPVFPCDPANSLKSQLEKVCEAADCEYVVDEVNKTLAVWPIGSARKSHPAVLLSPDTGLVGYPSFTQSGVQCTTLYNPNIRFMAPVEIQSQFTPANGKWSVQSLNHRLDCQVPGGQWFTDIECSFLDHPLPSV